MLRHSETTKHYFLAPVSFAIGLFLLQQLQKTEKNLTTEYFRQNKYIEQTPSPNQEIHHKSIRSDLKKQPPMKICVKDFK